MSMKNIFLIDKTRTDADTYKPSKKYFSLAKVSEDGKSAQCLFQDQWYNCRESFAMIWETNLQRGQAKTFFMCVGDQPEQRENIAEFLRITEEKKLKLKEFSTVSGFTNDETLILIQPATWWLENELRRQFLTALLRAGLYFYKNPKAVFDARLPLQPGCYRPYYPEAIIPEYKDYRKALYATRYFGRSQDAVRKFLNGFTELIVLKMSGAAGWLWVFDGNKNLDKLVKPKEKDEIIPFE